MSQLAGRIILLLFLSHGLVEGEKLFEINVQDFQRLADEVSRLGNLLEKQNEVIEEFQAKFEHQEVVNHELEALLTQNEDVIKDLSEQIKATKQDFGSIPTLPDTVADKAGTVENNKQSTSKRQAIRRQVSDQVAFFAVMKRSNQDGVGINQNIIFEDVVTDIGGGYNEHHGIFIVPVSGIYLITTSVLSRQGQEYYAEVMVNNVPIARLNGHGTDGRHGTGTQTMILYLKRGDDVAVQNYGTVDSFWGDKYTSFGGVLLHEYELNPSNIIG